VIGFPEKTSAIPADVFKLPLIQGISFLVGMLFFKKMTGLLNDQILFVNA